MKQGKELWWEQILYAEVKELSKVAKDYGCNSPYFKNALDLTFMGRTLILHDLCYITKAMLSRTEFLLWEI